MADMGFTPQPPRASVVVDPQVKMQRRVSAVSAAFGSPAMSQGRSRKHSAVDLMQRQLTAAANAEIQPPSMFVFRSHAEARAVTGGYREDASLGKELHRGPSQQVLRKLDREQRRSIVVEALAEDSLAHLVVESKKDKLHLPVENTPAIMSTSAAYAAFVEDDDPDAVWAHVRNENKERSSRRHEEQLQDIANRLDPKWWRHFSLRDFSDFLTPGLFSQEELECASESDGDDTVGNGTALSSPSPKKKDSMEVIPTEPSSAESKETSLHVVERRSTAYYLSKKQKSSTDLTHQCVTAWTQHITVRAPLHWLTPRRHCVHNGKSRAEIGTLTTVCVRDYAAMMNSLLGTCQAEERVLRLSIERTADCDVARLYQAYLYAKKPSPACADATLLLIVAETESREDIIEYEEIEMQWLLETEVVAPCEIAIAARESQRAKEAHIQILKELVQRGCGDPLIPNERERALVIERELDVLYRH